MQMLPHFGAFEKEREQIIGKHMSAAHPLDSAPASERAPIRPAFKPSRPIPKVKVSSRSNSNECRSSRVAHLFGVLAAHWFEYSEPNRWLS